MKVAVSCAGRFHAFNLVEQLYRRNALQQFITTVAGSTFFPNRALPPALAQDRDFLNKIQTIPLPEYLCYGLKNAPLVGNASFSYLVKDNLYDRTARKRIGKSDIFVGWANQSLFQLREAKTRGAIGIIERGSQHISVQQEILERERQAIGLKHSAPSNYDKLLEEKQLKEYVEADYIAVPSAVAKQSFIDRGFPERKIITQAYGIDIENFKPKEQYATSNNEPLKILTIGSVGVQKGFHYLLPAIQRARKSGVKVQLTVIGRMESEFAEWMTKAGLRQEIDTLIDFVPNSLLSQHFQRNDLFCLASVQEGVALVIGEAMASGVPVLATDATGGEELLTNEEGVIVPSASSDALADQLMRFAENRHELERLGRNAAARAQQLSWDNYGERILAEYQRVLDTHRTTVSSYEEFYDSYWDRSKAWTPTHSFTDEQLRIHFDGAFKREDKVLDVGTGDASNYQAWLVKQVKELHAIDISKTGIEKAKAMGLHAQVHDLQEPFPFKDNTFEGAVCVEVLEHLYDPKFCTKEIFRVLRPGGLLVTTVPNNGYIRERFKALTQAELSTSITDVSNEWKGAHIRFYNERAFTRLLETSGFTIEKLGSNGDSSIFDVLDAFGGHWMQHLTSQIRKRVPGPLRLSFLQNIYPSLFAPHFIVWARKPIE